MNEWDSGDLLALAPRVDERASKDLFDRRRDRRRRQRRIGVGATVAVVVLAVALVAVAWPADRGDETRVASEGPVDFHVLHVSDPDRHRGRMAAAGELAVATDRDELENLWREVDGAGGAEAPLVDFRDWFVVSVTVPSGGCPPELVSIELQGSLLVPEFTEQRPEPGEPPVLCTVGLGSSTQVVAIDRGPVPPAFTVHLPTSDVYPDASSSLSVEVPDGPEAPLGDPSDIDIEVLAIRRAPPSRAGELRASTDEASLRETWMANGLGQAPTVPVVDFDDRVVVFFSTSRGSCAPVLDGVARTGDTVTPLVADASERSADDAVRGGARCGPLAVVHTFVVAIDRVDVGDGFVLRLPADPSTHGEATLAVDAG